jgi:hypothetical protein
MQPLASSAVRRIAIEHVLPWVLVPLAVLSIYTLITVDRVPAIDVETLKGRADPHRVMEAGALTIRWSAERRHVCPATISREIVDSANTVFRLDRVSGPTSFTTGRDEWRSTITIPPAAAWGRAIYRSSIQYSCGWSHSMFPLIIQSPEVPFEIVPLTQKKIEELRG